MDSLFKAIPSGMDAFSAAVHGTATIISSAGSADSAAMLSSAAGALGPIGANYLAAFAPAQANNLAATKLVAHVHAAIGDATASSKTAIIAADNA